MLYILWNSLQDTYGYADLPPSWRGILEFCTFASIATQASRKISRFHAAFYNV